MTFAHTHLLSSLRTILQPSSSSSKVIESATCIWDASALPDPARFLAQNNAVPIVSHVLATQSSPRIVEIMLGIMANLVVNVPTIAVPIDLCAAQFHSQTEPEPLSEFLRLASCFLSVDNEAWFQLMEGDLPRITFIIENTFNPTLLGHALTVIEHLLSKGTTLSSSSFIHALASQAMILAPVQSRKRSLDADWSDDEAAVDHLLIGQLLRIFDSVLDGKEAEEAALTIPLLRQWLLLHLSRHMACVLSILCTLVERPWPRPWSIALTSDPDSFSQIITTVAEHPSLMGFRLIGLILAPTPTDGSLHVVSISAGPLADGIKSLVPRVPDELKSVLFDAVRAIEQCLAKKELELRRFREAFT